jgi:hypothetical protein
MALGQRFVWDIFKAATKAEGLKRRGKNMQEVDDALKAYWTIQAQNDDAAELAALLDLAKTCNSWLKVKKAKHDGGQGKQHFLNRWTEVTELGRASLAEARRSLPRYVQDDLSARQGQLTYEEKKFAHQQVAGNLLPMVIGLGPGYQNERLHYLKQHKTGNPISATAVRDGLGRLGTGINRQLLADALGKKMPNKVLNKNFDAMTVQDFETLEDTLLSDVGRQAVSVSKVRMVRFLAKNERIEYLAIPRNGRLCKTDGTLWNTGNAPEMYVMDEYGNLYISQYAVLRPTGSDPRINHSSLCAGKDVICAGEIKVTNGNLEILSNESGHYSPTGQNLYVALQELQNAGIDLNPVRCKIMLGNGHGFDGISANDVIRYVGNPPTNHPSYV